MINFLIFIVFFYLSLISVLGYGNIFQKIIFNKINVEGDINIYVGFYGLMFLTLISLFSSFFLEHNFYHNIILHLIGIFYFFFSSFKKKIKFYKHIFYISIFLIPLLLISKTHDDFSYYHYPFTKFLTENHIIFGMGHLNLGYNFLSSLFFLNSSFYLPFIKLFSFHYTAVFFLLFFNYFLFVKIFSNKTHEYFRYLYLLSFIFFNLSFNRVAEFGMDKGGQLLITLLIIRLFEIIIQDKIAKKLNQILLLIPLIGFCISTKTYFLTYLLLGFSIFLINKKYFRNFTHIVYTRSFLSFFFLIILTFSHHFISTGCLISPLPYLCFDQFFNWGRDANEIKDLSIWLEQWSKAGASPTYRIENELNYIKNFNWLSNWIKEYFLVKFIDQIAILFSGIVVIILFLKKFQLSNKKIFFKKKFLIFFSLIIIIFYIWFTNHPTLRYGGYSAFYLLISFPIAILFLKLKNRNNETRNTTIIIFLILAIVDFKNIIRINNEINRNDHYSFKNFPFFSIREKEYKENNYESGLTIYSAHHCWDTPTPCGNVSEKITVYNKNGYFFIQQLK